MICKVILKDGSRGEIDCNNYDNAPDEAWKKYGNKWSKIIEEVEVLDKQEILAASNPWVDESINGEETRH